MSSSTTQIRVREKHQVTLPMSIIRQAKISLDDVLNVSYSNGVITLHLHKKSIARPSLMSYAGSTKGLYGTNTAQRIAYINNQRASWDE